MASSENSNSVPMLNRIATALREFRFDEFRELLRAHPECLRHESGNEIWMVLACERGHLEIVKFLVEEMGVGVDELWSLSDPTGTPLLAACSNGHYDIVQWLLDHGARIDNVPGRFFPLFAAAMHDHVEVVKLLIDRGASTDFVWQGRNVLMEAETYGAKKVIEYVRSIGVRDLREITPPDFVATHKRVRKIITHECGRIGEWTYRIPDVSNDIVIQVAGPKHPGDSKYLFTVGMSDLSLTCPHFNDPLGFVIELRIPLPEIWPLDEESLKEPQWNWPVRELERIVKELQTTRVWPHSLTTFPHGDPPVPFAEGTRQNCWVAFVISEASYGYYDLPDYRNLVMLRLVSAYPEEVSIFLEGGEENNELQVRFKANHIPEHVDLYRPNLAEERFAIPDEYFVDDAEDSGDDNGQCQT